MATIITETRGLNNATATITPNDWVPAKVIAIIDEATDVRSFVLEPAYFLAHQAGQHYELRLRSENGYEAARPYSAAPVTGPAGTMQLTIQHVPNGEVSAYVYGELSVGDSVEIRGPFGRFFVWDSADPSPVLLIGGGSGIVPLAAIFDTHQKAHVATQMRVIYSTHTYDDIIYKDLFTGNAAVDITLTRDAPADWNGHTGRLSQELVKSVLDQYQTPLVCYICGMSPFVSAVNEILQELGIPAASIKTERFG